MCVCGETIKQFACRLLGHFGHTAATTTTTTSTSTHSPSTFTGTGGNSTSMSFTPSSMAAITELATSLTSSAYDSGLYVILPAALASLPAACGSALHAVVCLRLLRAADAVVAAAQQKGLVERLCMHRMPPGCCMMADCICVSLWCAAADVVYVGALVIGGSRGATNKALCKIKVAIASSIRQTALQIVSHFLN